MVRLPEIYPGYASKGIGLQEIDKFGEDPPLCGQADHLLGVSPTRVREHHRGHFDGWRCVWEVGSEECKRCGVRLYATNPGTRCKARPCALLPATDGMANRSFEAPDLKAVPMVARRPKANVAQQKFTYAIPATPAVRAGGATGYPG